MKTLSTLVASALALSSLAAGCAVEMPSEEELASTEQAECYNREGVNAVLAAMAVATGKELRRFKPAVDFQLNSDNVLELTAAGKARCYDGVCRNTQALLDMQKWEANGKVVFPGGTKLDVASLRSRLSSNFGAQLVCNSRPDNHKGDNCPVEEHDLKFVGTSMGTCGLDFKFHAYKAGTTTKLDYPAQLKNQLIWANPLNPFVAFTVVGDDITVDPTGGLVEGDSTASGSCAAVCTKYSFSSVSGACCSCSGLTKTFARSSFNALNGSIGLKVNVAGRLLLDGNLLFALDDHGVRDRVVPLFAFEYAF